MIVWLDAVLHQPMQQSTMVSTYMVSTFASKLRVPLVLEFGE